MIYTVDPTADEPIMLISTHIGDSETEGMGVDGSLFQAELMQLDTMGKKRIQIYINSPGGDVDAGMMIYHAILNTKTKVDTYNVFACCSIAAVIFQAGRSRIMADYALLMFHAPYYTKEEAGNDNEVLNLFKQSCVKAISQRSGKPEDAIDTMLEKDTWMNAQEAIAQGFADEIQESADYNKKRITVKATAAERSDPRRLFAKGNKILNSIITPSSNMKKIIAARFKINAEAEDSVFIEAVDKLFAENAEYKSKIQASATDMEALAKKVEAAEKECARLKAEYDDMDGKMKASVKATADKELEGKTEKAKALVSIHVKAGRVKNDPTIIEKWEKKAIADYDDTKEVLEAIGITKTADKVIVASEGAVKGMGSAAVIMHTIAARTQQKIG